MQISNADPAYVEFGPDGMAYGWYIPFEDATFTGAYADERARLVWERVQRRWASKRAARSAL